MENVFRFEQEEWEEKIKHPLWYKETPQLLKSIMALKQQDENEFQKIKERVYSFFETKLKEDAIALGNTGKDFDKERKHIDTVVIHHTHGDESMTNERLSAMELLRLYALYYASPTYENDKDIIDQPIYSGHFRNGKQVFYPYHWIVRKDGSKDRLLNDNEIGWHSGNWEINCKSVAIALDGNYENSTPSEKELSSIAEIIRECYSEINKELILGHREINAKTICPSNLFLEQNGQSGWKQRIVEIR